VSKAQKFWDTQAKRFDGNDKQFESANLELIARVKKYLEPGDSVLDFGCGTGTKTIALAGVVRNIKGLDFSAEMIKVATIKKDEAKVANASFVHGTIYDQDLKAASFEKIVAFSIIHLLQDSEMTIRRIHELLKPGGMLIAETACFRDRMNFKTRIEVNSYLLMKRLGIFPLHLNRFSVPGMERMINRNSFMIVNSERLFFNGMTISFIVAEKL